MSARSLVTCVLLLLSATSTASAQNPGLSDAKAQKAAVKCQKAIDQAGAKLSATKLKSLEPSAASA